MGTGVLAWLVWMQPFLPVICFGVAWLFLGLLAWNLWALGREGLGIAKRMHQIPCSQCQFFSRDYRLKCALHPHQAATDAAIACPDFHD